MDNVEKKKNNGKNVIVMKRRVPHVVVQSDVDKIYRGTRIFKSLYFLLPFSSSFLPIKHYPISPKSLYGLFCFPQQHFGPIPVFKVQTPPSLLPPHTNSVQRPELDPTHRHLGTHLLLFGWLLPTTSAYHSSNIFLKLILI